MRVVDRELLLRHSLWSPVPDDGFLFRHGPFLRAVAINEMVAASRNRLQILVDVVGAGGRVHPAGAIVEALIDEELPPGYRTVVIQPLLTGHLDLGPEEKRRVRIDEKERVMRKRVRRGDGSAVRAAVRIAFNHTRGDVLRSASVERGELREVHGLDVGADASVAERQRHPRLEARDDLCLHLRVLI